jgi:2-amino-4-hydroxy-6-hydroxymethyldihydropteridine diphosphokinase
MKHQIYLGLGSNLGDREENLLQAIQKLEPEIHPQKVSSIFETSPWGYLDQPGFLNCAVEAVTGLTPRKLLQKLKTIESEMGRQPSIHFGPRLIDLDILLYDDLILSTKNLTIPHPLLVERAFVLVPLSEIASDLRHPISGETMGALVALVDKTGVIFHADHLKEEGL